MLPLYTAKDCAQVDRLCAEVFGKPVLELMERAGAALAEEVARRLAPDGCVVVLCGPGNNGGDGLVAARLLASAGKRVRVSCVGHDKKLSEGCQRNKEALAQLGVEIGSLPKSLPLSTGDVVVDALLGTGLSRAPEGDFAAAIRQLAYWRDEGAHLVSADIPSGLNSDTGKPFFPCVEADTTVTFGAWKLGLFTEPGASLAGEVVLRDIGIPFEAWRRLPDPFCLGLEESSIVARLPPSAASTHKGQMGHVLVLAGSPGKSGAAALASMAALRSGAGLVTVATRPNVLSRVLAFSPELMGFELPGEGAWGLKDVESAVAASEGKQAIVMGPGLARGTETHEFIREFLTRVSVPCVLDADALNALAGHLEILDSVKVPLLLTPHPGEMARLVGTSTHDIQMNRVATVLGFVMKHRVALVLKGSRTVMGLPDGRMYINPTGNAGMATAGSGDVLAGLSGALLASGLSVETAMTTAVFAHGLAGDLAVQRTGMRGLIASDLIDGIRDVWVRWNR